MTQGERRRWQTAAAMAKDPAWRERAGRMMFFAEIADYKYRTPQEIDPRVVAAIVHCGRLARKNI